MSLVPVIDPLACSAHGDCAAIAPRVFRLEETAVVVSAGPPDLIIKGAQACPAVAISVVDDATGEQIYP